MVTAKASVRAALGDTVILVTKEKTTIVSFCLTKKGPTRCYTPGNSNQMLQHVGYSTEESESNGDIALQSAEIQPRGHSYRSECY